MENRKDHWENVYRTKELSEVSWYQPVPGISLDFIEESHLPKNAKIIDIGGGDSFLVDHLLNLGYSDLTVLDISEAAVNRAKTRLGPKAGLVTWIVSDVADFIAPHKYDMWHDRAAFHFFTEEDSIKRYITAAANVVKKDGFLVIGTFSEAGPKKCSGLDIRQYSQTSIGDVFKDSFNKIKCVQQDHLTPFHTLQNFLFCSFKRK